MKAKTREKLDALQALLTEANGASRALMDDRARLRDELDAAAVELSKARAAQAQRPWHEEPDLAAQLDATKRLLVAEEAAHNKAQEEIARLAEQGRFSANMASNTAVKLDDVQRLLNESRAAHAETNQAYNEAQKDLANMRAEAEALVESVSELEAALRKAAAPLDIPDASLLEIAEELGEVVVAFTNRDKFTQEQGQTIRDAGLTIALLLTCFENVQVFPLAEVEATERVLDRKATLVGRSLLTGELTVGLIDRDVLKERTERWT